MEPIGVIKKFANKSVKKDPHLHSPNHVLADELSRKLRDAKRFGFYLKMATSYDHNFLRKLAGEVLERRDVYTPGKLFAYLIKQHNQEKRITKNE